jgi:hypothetical protein
MVRLITYRGRRNAIEITNGIIRLVVIPDIARIVHYSFVEDENVLLLTADFDRLTLLSPEEYIEKGIRNTHFGGDRVLTSSEDYFHLLTGSRFISDPWLTSSVYDFKLLPDGIEICSPISELLGVQLTRRITIQKQGSTVHIDQKLRKIKNAITPEINEIPLTIWNLTQIRLPQNTWLPLQDKSVFKNRFEIPVWPDGKNWANESYAIEGSLLRFWPHAEYPQKIGADANGWVAGLVDDVLMVEKFSPLEKMKYPDGGTSATIFTCPELAELECLSPEKVMKVGEVIEHSISWELIKISDDNNVEEVLKSIS